MPRQRYYENFAPQNPYMQRQMQNAQLSQAQANANQAQANAYNTNPVVGGIFNIAQKIADRYNERGVYKGNGYLTDFFNNYGKTPQTVGQPQEGSVPQNVPPAEAVAGGIGAGVNIPSPTEEARLARKEAYLGKFSENVDDPNPNGSALSIKNGINALDQAGDQVDFSKVDRATLYRQAEEMLKANGLTNRQRGQVLSNFDNIYNEKIGKYNEGKVTDLIAKGQAAAKQGKWDEAQNLFLSAGQINPKLASMYMQGLTASYNRNMAERKFALDAARIAARGAGAGAGTLRVPGVYGDAKNGYFARGDNGQLFATDAYGQYKPMKIKIGGSRYTAQQAQMAQKTLDNPLATDDERQSAKDIMQEFMYSQAPIEYDIASPDGIARAMEAVHKMGLTYQDEKEEMHRLGIDKSPYWNRAFDRFDKNLYYSNYDEESNDKREVRQI